MDSLIAFRETTKNGGSEFETLDRSGGSPIGLAEAAVLRITSSGAEFDSNSTTAFESADDALGSIDLKTVVNCWQCKDLSMADYIQHSTAHGIPNSKFMERTDLLDWLDGSSDTSEYIKTDISSEFASGKVTEDVDMPDFTVSDAVTSHSREPALNRSTILHGSKMIDFSNVAALSHKTLVSEFRHANSSRPSSAKNSGLVAAKSGTLPSLKPSKGKDPIILLSPSPSSLINMANVQDFLEKGIFNPVSKSAGSSNLLRVVRNSKLIGSKVRFVVVDSIDQFKPEYWDRVVAVFVTGQLWQFRGYRWPDPNSLFQHVLGFGLVYKNDPIPETLKQWNVKVEPLDRNARFRDREVVERIWEMIETHMISRGWPVNAT